LLKSCKDFKSKQGPTLSFYEGSFPYPARILTSQKAQTALFFKIFDFTPFFGSYAQPKGAYFSFQIEDLTQPFV